MKLDVGLFGLNGHSINSILLPEHPRARLAAIAAVPEADEVARKVVAAGGRWHADLEGLLADDVQLVSFCSPNRSEQAGHSLAALRAGKHVYAEKPVAFTEADLDALLAAAEEHGVIFHDMGHTSFDPPYSEVKRLLATGEFGEVVQVVAQKSYPWRDSRPDNEDNDGGLVRQAGIHAVRMIEHCTGLRVREVNCRQSRLGNPTSPGRDKGAFMASVWMLTLDNGGVAAITANYLNPGNTGGHGYETLQVFATGGLIQTHPDQTLSVYPTGGEPRHTTPDARRDYFELVLDQVIDGKPFPLTVDEEMHPTRVVIRAWDDAMAHSVHGY